MKLHTGFVAITGKPNVGKSTLINTLFKKKIAITSYKPQTTRNQIIDTYSDHTSSITFIDTPGYHDAHNKLDMFLNSEIKSSYKVADVVMLLIDLTRKIDEEDLQVIKIIKSYEVKKVLLVLTKSDLNQKNIEPYKEEIKKLIDYDGVVVISSKTNTNLDEMLIQIKKMIPLTETVLSNIATSDNDDFIIKEIVREQVIFHTKKEVPYATAIVIQEKTYNEGLLTIMADIVVERDSQKPIIIGAKGSMIKKIGTFARKELLEIFDCKINLKLFVKTVPD
jgi:GTP-binding protein Era